MDFDNPKVYGDTSISDGLVFLIMRISHFWLKSKNFPTLLSSPFLIFMYDLGRGQQYEASISQNKSNYLEMPRSNFQI